MKLYKYCSAKAGIEIIRNSRVKLSYPSSFNDPFDCIFDIDKKEIEESKELVLNYEIFKALNDTIHRNDLKLTSSAQKVIIKDLRRKFDTCKTLMRKTKKFVKIPSLNELLKDYPITIAPLKTKSKD